MIRCEFCNIVLDEKYYHPAAKFACEKCLEVYKTINHYPINHINVKLYDNTKLEKTFQREYLCEVPKIDPLYKKALEVAGIYHKRCDEYDKIVCGNKEGKPANSRELYLVQKHARDVKREMRIYFRSIPTKLLDIAIKKVGSDEYK